MKLDKPLIPDICTDCEYLCISHAIGFIKLHGHPVATCKINRSTAAPYFNDDFRGTYAECMYVLYGKNTPYKCIK